MIQNPLPTVLQSHVINSSLSLHIFCGVFSVSYDLSGAFSLVKPLPILPGCGEADFGGEGVTGLEWLELGVIRWEDPQILLDLPSFHLKKHSKCWRKKNEMFIRLQNTIEFADEDFKEKCVYMYVYLFLKTWIMYTYLCNLCILYFTLASHTICSIHYFQYHLTLTYIFFLQLCPALFEPWSWSRLADHHQIHLSTWAVRPFPQIPSRPEPHHQV